jgi:dTDP-4-amino-4,6-dideoxygalactose transaminase
MIRMNDFRADPPALLDAEVAACQRVIRSGWYVLGEEVAAFESAWAQACGTAHAVGVGNGLDAIEIVIRALGLGSGDEIVTTPMTAFATVLAIIRAGATPVLADIDADSGLLSRVSAEEAISSRTRAILLVHLYGQVRDMEAWKDLCDRHGLHLIEDCAQSHLAAWNGKIAGSFGVAGAYSFYPTKNLGAPGDAGALVTSDGELAARARMLRNYGQANRYEHAVLGMNSRLDELEAAMLSERLQWLTRFTRKRQAIAARYYEGLRNPRLLPLAPPQQAASHVFHLFVVRCPQRDRLAAHLRDCHIESLIHYPIPAHRQPALADLSPERVPLANSQHHARECLSIPCHHNLTDEQVDKVIDALNAFE